MADNLALDPGTNTTAQIATDEAGGYHYQKIKLFDPTADSTTGIGIAANPLYIQGTVTTGSGASSTATLSNVAASASSVSLLVSNASRKGAVIFNDSTVSLYVKFGATASSSSFTYKLFPYETLEVDRVIYTGAIDGIWESATGNARITELT